jgi:hypothetical protein
MRKLVPIFLGTAGLGFFGILLAARKMRSGKLIAYETSVRTASAALPTQSVSAQPRSYVQTMIIPKQLSLEIINSARKWANVRGIPLQEVLATILVESSGNPRAWNRVNPAKEDSRGLMQVNVNAWKPVLVANGMTTDDLWDIDKNIQIGTSIYAQYRKKVQDLIAQSDCSAAKSVPVATLTRLYYKGPAYVITMIKECGPALKAMHPYRDAEKAVANWDSAMSKVSAVA